MRKGQGVACLALGAALLALPASADDARKHALAQELLQATHANDAATQVADSMIDNTIGQLTRLLVKLNPQDGPVIKQILDDELIPAMRAGLPDLIAGTATLWEQHFSEDELAQLVDFYKTPLGAKLIHEQPLMFQESLKLGQAWGRALSQRVLPGAIERLHQHGLKTDI